MIRQKIAAVVSAAALFLSPVAHATEVRQSELTMLSTLVMAEAEGECELGKRLVIDVVLNRVDDPCFPGTVSGVILQRNQFSCITNGRYDRCYPTVEVTKLILEELEKRTNSEAVFFQCGGYSRYGVALFKVGSHYFCGCRNH